MEYTRSEILDVVLIVPQMFGDERGFFMETFRQKELEAFAGPVQFVQDNHSGSAQGILRGLHYQLRQTQGKLLRVVAGEIFDVAVDIRRGSATFGKWVGYHLSAENRHELWVPAGFAHGFYTISPWAELVYKATDYYAPEWERSLRWDDPALAIPWPLVNGQAPLLSNKDAQAPLLAQAEVFGPDWQPAQFSKEEQ